MFFMLSQGFSLTLSKLPKILSFNVERTTRLSMQRDIEQLKKVNNRQREKMDSLQQELETQCNEIKTQRQELETQRQELETYRQIKPTPSLRSTRSFRETRTSTNPFDDVSYVQRNPLPPQPQAPLTETEGTTQQIVVSQGEPPPRLALRTQSQPGPMTDTSEPKVDTNASPNYVSPKLHMSEWTKHLSMDMYWNKTEEKQLWE